MNIPRRFIAGFVVCTLAITACGSPDSAQESSKKTEASAIDDAQDTLDEQREAHAEIVSGYSFMSGYSAEDTRATNFDNAEAALAEAEAMISSTVDPIIKNWSESPEDQTALDAALAAVAEKRQEAQDLINEALAWPARVAEVQSSPSTYVITVTEAAEGPLDPDRVETATNKYPQQADLISERASALADSENVMNRGIDTVVSEAEKSSPNYGVMLANGDAVTTTRSEVIAFHNALIELDVTETWTLVDIRVDTFVGVERTSWDERSDANTEVDYEYVIAEPVSIETGDALAAVGLNGTIASGDRNGVSLQNNMSETAWNELGIDPGEAWPEDRHDRAEWYFAEIEDNICHQVQVYTDGEPGEANPQQGENYCAIYDTPADTVDGKFWIEGDELLADSIGMDIYSKGAGDFADQAHEDPAPPGIIYVGDPNYGEWRDDNGTSFWAFYGQYAFFSNLIGGNGHSRGYYNTWNNDYRGNRGAYYAPTTNGTPRFGQGSAVASSNFKSTNYRNSGLDTASVRGAGPASRSGGPGSGK